MRMRFIYGSKAEFMGTKPERDLPDPCEARWDFSFHLEFVKQKKLEPKRQIAIRLSSRDVLRFDPVFDFQLNVVINQT